MTKGTHGASTKVIETYDGLICNSFTATATSRALSANHVNAYATVVQNDHDSGVPIYVGGPLRQTIRLNAGESITIAVDPSLIYVHDLTATATVRWLAVT